MPSVARHKSATSAPEELQMGEEMLSSMYREVGEDDGQTDLRAAHKDLVGRVEPHDHAYGDDHLQMAVFVLGVPAANL